MASSEGSGVGAKGTFQLCVNNGPRLAAMVVYLLHLQLLPGKRLAALMADLFGVYLVGATIGAMSRTRAARFQGFAAAMRDRVAAAPVKHMDETAHNLLRRLHGRKPDVLRFLSDPMVPFTNNLAERDGRMLEPRSGSRVRQKISGGFRSFEGAGDFAVIRSLLSTARKQGWDIPRALASRPDRLIAELRSA